MATRALQQVITYTAWDTSANAFKTGDSANHTTSWCKDGTRSATTNATAEVDATNLPGLYKVTMTSTETDCIEGVLGGKSSTANIVLIPTMVAFDYLNTSAPTAAGIPDVNMKNAGGTAVTGRDIGASVLLSAGTGTGQLDFTSGVVKANLAQILGTALTETAGQIAAAFKQFFNIASPTSTMNEITLVDTVTTYTGNTKQTGDAFARLGAPAGASVSADVAAVKSDTGNIAAVKTQTDKLTFTVANVIDANVLRINGNAAAASQVEHTNQALCRGTVGNASSTTSIVCSAIASPASLGASGQMIGRTILFDADTSTTNLQGQATSITANTTGATPTFTCTALTTAPVSGDTFTII